MVANISLLLQASATIQPMSIDTARRHSWIPLFTKSSSIQEVKDSARSRGKIGQRSINAVIVQ
jgi:hypothetical protein